MSFTFKAFRLDIFYRLENNIFHYFTNKIHSKNISDSAFYARKMRGYPLPYFQNIISFVTACTIICSNKYCNVIKTEHCYNELHNELKPTKDTAD